MASVVFGYRQDYDKTGSTYVTFDQTTYKTWVATAPTVSKTVKKSVKGTSKEQYNSGSVMFHVEGGSGGDQSRGWTTSAYKTTTYTRTFAYWKVSNSESQYAMGARIELSSLPSRGDAYYNNSESESWSDFETTSITPPTTSKTYYSFAGWYTSASGGTKVESDYHKYVNLYAHWTRTHFSINFRKKNSDGSGWEALKTLGPYLKGSTQNIYVGDGTTYNQLVSSTRLVTFDANGGSLKESDTYREYLAKFTRYYISNGSYDWSSGTNYGSPLTFKNQQSISITIGGSDSTYNAQYVQNGQSETTYTDLDSIPTPTRSGATFDGWYYKGTKVSNDDLKANPENYSGEALKAYWRFKLELQKHKNGIGGEALKDETYKTFDLLEGASFTIDEDSFPGNWVITTTITKSVSFDFNGGVCSSKSSDSRSFNKIDTKTTEFNGYWGRVSGYDFGDNKLVQKSYNMPSQNSVYLASYKSEYVEETTYTDLSDVPVPTKKGHVLVGYASVDYEGTLPPSQFSYIKNNPELFPNGLIAVWKWDDNYVIIKTSLNPAGIGWVHKVLEDDDNTGIFKIGTKVTLYTGDRPNYSYEFYNWSYEYYGHQYWNGATVQITVPGSAKADHTVNIVANFRRNCKVTYYGKDGEQLGLSFYSMIDDSGYITFTTSEMTKSYDGYKFVNYSIEGYSKETTPQKTTVMVKAPSSYEIKVYSNWERIKYSISVKTDPEFKNGKRLSDVNVYRQSKQAWDTTKSGLDYWSDSTLEYGDIVQVAFGHTSTYVKSADNNGWSSTLTTISYNVKYSSIITATYDELYKLHIKQNGAKGDVFVSINGTQTKPSSYGILEWWWDVKSSDTVKITWSSSEYFPEWGGDALELFNKNSSTLELTNKWKIASNIDITCDWVSPQYYYVKSNNTNWGTVYPKNDSSDPAKAHAPDKIVVQATPKPGYKFNSFSYYDKNRKFRVKYHTVCSEYDGTYYCSIDPSDFSTNKSDPTKISATFAADKLTLKLCQEGSGGVSYSIDDGDTVKLTRDGTIIELDPASKHVFKYTVDTSDVEVFKKVVITPWNGTSRVITVPTGSITLNGDNYTVRFYFADSRGDLYVDPVIRYSSSDYIKGTYDGGLLPYEEGTPASVLVAEQGYSGDDTYTDKEGVVHSLVGECTWYAHYRSGQMRGAFGAGAPYGSGEIPSHLWNNANEWPSYHGGNWTLEGDIQVGDVAIEGWANSNHVLVVEAIDSDGTITMSHFNTGGNHCYNGLRTVYWEDRDRYIFLHNTTDKVISSGTGKPAGHTAIFGVKEADCGFVSGGAENMIYGQETTIEAHPNSGYEFKYWITPTGSKEFTDILTIVMTDEGKSGVYTAVITKVGDEDPIEDGEEVPTYYTEFTATTYGCTYEDDSGKDMWNYDYKDWVIGEDVDAYTELNYIESSKDVGQYLTTYWHGNIFCKLVIDGQFTSFTPYQYMGSNGSPENFCFGLNSSGKLKFNDSSAIQIDTNRHVFEVNGNGYCKFDNEVVYMTPLDRTQGRYINLFSRDGYVDQGGGEFIKSKMASDFKLYACKIYDDGELVRDFIPAKRKRDGKVGLWENVYKEFYYDNKNNFDAGEEKGELNKWDQ